MTMTNVIGGICMSKGSLDTFLNEIHHWTTRFKEHWNQSTHIKENLENLEVEQFENNLNHHMERISYFLDYKDEFNKDVANELKLQAHNLADQWQQLDTNNPQRQVNDNVVGIGQHQLPPLPYAYNALEPYIDERIMRLHHDKHHRSYVNGLNKAERELEKARRQNNFDLVKHWERELAFNGAGHYLHTIFWYIMSPEGGGKPRGNILRAINQSFGSFDQFKKQFSEAAKNVEGVGWAILVYSPRSHRLEILQAEKHQNLSQWDVIPLLVLDVWEHAYYLQYENDRDQYVDQWWNIVDWDEVGRRYNEARKVKWKAY